MTRLDRWFTSGRWALWIVGLVTFAVRLPYLARPPVYVFDEVYYAPDAADLLQWGAESGRAVHPPLGKWLIGAGIRVFGFTPLGWRISSVVAGALVAVLVAGTVRVLGGRPLLVLCAGLAVCVDGIMFVTSRLALLDVFVALFTSLALWFTAAAWTSQPDHRRCRRMIAGALVSVGAATAVKWSGAWLAPVVAVAALALDRRLLAPGAARRAALARTVAKAVAVPLAVYGLAWVPRELGPARLSPKGLWYVHYAIAKFHIDLRPTNIYAASGTTWFLQTAPTALYKEQCTAAMARSPAGVCPVSSHATEIRILAVSNPVVWAAGLAGMIALLVRAGFRRDRFAIVVLAVVGTQWLPWIINPRAGYSFYQATLVPPLVVGAAYALSRGQKRVWRLAGPVVVVGATAMFVYLYPLFAGLPLTHGAAQARLLWGSWP